MKKNWIYILISVAVLAGGIYFLNRLAPQFLQKIGISTEVSNLPVAPDFTLNDLTGQKLKLSDLRGKIVILNFWTSWNEPSLEQAKILNGYYKSYSPADVVILTVDSQEDAETANAIKNRESLDVKILLDNEGEIGELYGIGALPLTIFIDKSGLEAIRTVGPIAANEIEQKIASLR